MGLLLGSAVLALSTACSTTVVGVAAPAEPAGPAGPGPAPGSSAAVPFAGNGQSLESLRLSVATPLVEEHFPDRTESCSAQGGLTSAVEVELNFFGAGEEDEDTGVGVDRVSDILNARGFVAAWGQCGLSAEGAPTTQITTVELADPAAAEAAVEELVTALGTPASQSSTTPDGARVLVTPEGGQDVVQAFVASGRLLGYTLHSAPAGQGRTGIDGLVADHVELMDAFTPTPPDELGDLPSDPYGLAELTTRPPGRSLGHLTGSYDLEGYLRNALDPATKRDLLGTNGFVGMHLIATDANPLSYRVLVFAFPSSAQTNAVYAGFAESERARLADATPFVLPAIPDAPCFRVPQQIEPPEPDPLDSLDPSATPAPTGPITVYVQRCYVGFGGYLAAVLIGGVAEPDDYTEMTRLLTAQRDLIDG